MILVVVGVFIVGALASAAAPEVELLVIARIVIGVAIGLASAAAPVYLSEVAPPESRGRLVSFFQLAVTISPRGRPWPGSASTIPTRSTASWRRSRAASAGSILAAVGVGVINVAMTLVAMRLLDRAGRRTLLMVGVSGMVISLFALGAAFIGGGGSTLSSVVAIVSLMTYVASFAVSLGPIFWLLNAEIYPLSVRSKAAGLGTMANWTFNFIVSLTFLLLIEALGRSGAFWLYGAIGILTLIFCWKLVPETKGKRLEDIQAYFQTRIDKSGATSSAPAPPH